MAELVLLLLLLLLLLLWSKAEVPWLLGLRSPGSVVELCGGDFNTETKGLEVLLAQSSSCGSAVWGGHNSAAEPENAGF